MNKATPLRRRRGRTGVVQAAVLTAALIVAVVPAGAAPIDDVRATVGMPLDDAPSSKVAAAVRDAITALPPEDLEQAIDLVGAVTEEVGERQAAAEIAGAAQSAVDDVARQHPDEIEAWWASIIKDSVLTVVEEKLAAAEQTGADDADALAGAEDLPLVTVRELPASDDQGQAPAEPTPAPPEPTAAVEPEPEPEPAPERDAAPPRQERIIAVQPVRDRDREPVQLGAPPRTLDQQLAERQAAEQAPSAPVPLEEQISTAADLLRRQGRPITTETLNRAMIELGGNCSPLDLEALRAAARYGRCRDELAQRLAGSAPAAGTPPGQTATAPTLDDREAFRNMVRGYATGTRR